MDTTKNIILALILIIFSCTSDNEKSSSLLLQNSYEDLMQAKTDWPGLFISKDSTVTIIALVGDDDVIQESFMYKGASDTLWTKVIHHQKLNENNLEDTIIHTFVAKPIWPDTTLMNIYFMSGFNESIVTIINNDETIFEGSVKMFTTIIKLNKKSIGRMKIIIDGKSAILERRPLYNFLELINRDSILMCNYRYYFPLPD